MYDRSPLTLPRQAVNAPAGSIEYYGPAASRLQFERGTDGPRVILVGIDGSRTSGHAIAYAVGMARRQRCRLVVVFVQAQGGLVALSAMTAAAARAANEELAGELRLEVQRMAEELCVPTTFITRRGDPYLTLRETADQTKADSVVVGASTWAGHRFVGSIAARLVRLGRWPVVVVP
jgi:nucleotide-binding universal stress UspA family protein